MSDTPIIINTSPTPERIWECMARTTLNAVMRFWEDTDKTIPEDLTGSLVEMAVTDKSGNLIIGFSSTGSPGGITIQNTNELVFLKSKSDMTLPIGQYLYVLQFTKNSVTTPLLKGDFIIRNNPNG